MPLKGPRTDRYHNSAILSMVRAISPSIPICMYIFSIVKKHCFDLAGSGPISISLQISRDGDCGHLL
ncbi:hypothetical protein E2C01_102849 [Portunus trituberculatus]|uniref:Uncharacterized protein n=1 Tax=Portunus trituberculatus TaxID=210409 RepID=A0A5B7KNH9_PORTR|nr:hypothetical protein [Portunus trituberculatus]